MYPYRIVVLQHIHIQRLEPLIRRLLRISGNQPTIVLLFRTGDSPILAERRNSPLRYIPVHCCLSYRDHFSHKGIPPRIKSQVPYTQATEQC